MDASATRVVSCGYWDNSLRVHALDSLKEVACATSGHVGAITCVQMDRQGGHLVLTGGEDGTCRVWLLENYSQLASLYDDLRPKGLDLGPHEDTNLVCVHVLCGHQAPVSCMHYSPDMDLLLSGADDGSLCLHSVRRGEFVRLITSLRGVSVDLVFVTAQGYLIAHSWSALRTWLFWVNGQELHEAGSVAGDVAQDRFPTTSARLWAACITCYDGSGWSVSR